MTEIIEKENLSIGELLAIVASESSQNPFVGSDTQKEAWDEIKNRFSKLEEGVDKELFDTVCNERDEAQSKLSLQTPPNENGMVEIPDKYLPKGVGGSSIDPVVLRAHIDALYRTQFPHIHTMDLKPWVVLYLLDRAGL